MLQVDLGQCPRSLAACSAGLSVALWARVDVSMLTSSTKMMLVSYPPSFWMYVTNDQVLHVELATCQTATWNASAYLGRWNNYALAYRADLGLSVYVNGLRLVNTTYGYSASSDALCSSSWTWDSTSQALTVGYVITGTNSPQGMPVSNLALWLRYVHPLEAHLFLGMTGTCGTASKM